MTWKKRWEKKLPEGCVSLVANGTTSNFLAYSLLPFKLRNIWYNNDIRSLAQKTISHKIILSLLTLEDYGDEVLLKKEQKHEKFLNWVVRARWKELNEKKVPK
ncbi:hypothetical protein BOH78_4841 [Pichia kudriavzevii]|uniref:Uncharacterized protein n=1 Tax=Pichia kudriavzevii TaxID=4909 RepID=A0A1V2LFW2_PICKU|nr:hypothetical protein BOH78_4841 [Pichia kudriavzevii]